MLNILAIDTSTQACSVALSYQQETLSRFAVMERQQAAHILPMIDEVLQQAKVQLDQLQALTFTAGPGSFTGIRLAAAIVQGLAYGANLPVIPLSTLQALAQGAYEDLQIDKALVAINAHAKAVYWGVYQLDKQGIMQPICPDQRYFPAEIPAPPGEGWTGIGDAWGLYPTELTAYIPSLLNAHADRYPDAKHLLAIANHHFLQGQTKPANQALPNYLQDWNGG